MMNTHIANDGDWIAVQTYCGNEKSVADTLQDRGYQQFVPLYTDYRVRRGREERIERSLFPGYLFCRYVRCPSFRIVEIPAVVRLVGISTGPLKIEDEEIENIRILVDSGLYSEPWKFLVAGEAVLVSRGVLRGARGTLVAVKNGMRLVISIPILGRAVAVEVNGCDVVRSPSTVPTVESAAMQRRRVAGSLDAEQAFTH